MKILSGLIYHESNTFNPFLTGLDQFVVREGEEILDRFASTAVFRQAGADVVPSVYATAFSSGPVTREAYEYLKARLLRAVEQHSDLDGIWLHLHGAMLIDGVGAAEVDLLQAVRERVGAEMPISVALDPHGNLDPRVPELATVLRSYRTIPHVDQPEIERRTAHHLLEILSGKVQGGAVAHSQVPFVISGDIPLSASSPLSDILAALDEVEALPGIMDASFFVGFAWADVSQCGASVVVVPERPECAGLAREQADKIRDLVLERYREFQFETPTLEVTATVDAFTRIGRAPLVVSDSGDNTTGGGAGYSTVVLKEVLGREHKERVCVSTIWSPDSFLALRGHSLNDRVRVSVGMDHDEYSRPIEVEGVLKARGDLLGYMSSAKDKVGNTCTVTVGNVDVVVTDRPGSFVTLDHFRAAGLDPADYSVIVVKQGYLFPEIAELAGQHVMCISAGATYQFIEHLSYQNVARELLYVADRVDG
ncbi:M81 family metallopeptidase [Ruania zhangjianzhongii]|uniref:M81 family metallopeptidase n=1 Tax=Ruania zhangjianzhongii TaxID=2603206 RepID=UPI0011C90B5E|nr:M81 family metallopeptidase [Ruania zhangjianzhongii]